MYGPVLFWHHISVRYTKPHLKYDEQVKLLASRGLDVGHEAEAVRALKRIGYYRLSAYTYPFRNRADSSTGAESTTPKETFRSGYTLAHAVNLHDFDHRLRGNLLSATQVFEVGLRTKVAYTLGKRGAFAHLDIAHLNLRECQSDARGPDHDGTKYEVWKQGYDRLQREAKNEVFVQHFLSKYDGDVPIWAAVEFMTFGSLIALYRLLDNRDSKRIAEEFGVLNQQVFHGWCKALNVLRNHCAHNGRVWNRHTIYPPSAINRKMVGEELHHLEGADQNRLYYLAAILAYLHKQMNAKSRFASEFTTTMKKFPPVPGLSPEKDMGFVREWRSEHLWALH